MKFDIAALLSLASVVVANPMYDINLNLPAAAGLAQTKHGIHTNAEICWRVCASEELDCPEGWYESGEPGGCHTCCKDFDSDKAKVAVVKPAEFPLAKTKHGIHTFQLVCLYICSLEALDCPKDWYSKKLGDCYTCCKDGR